MDVRDDSVDGSPIYPGMPTMHPVANASRARCDLGNLGTLGKYPYTYMSEQDIYLIGLPVLYLG